MPYDPQPKTQKPVHVLTAFVSCAMAGFAIAAGTLAFLDAMLATRF